MGGGMKRRASSILILIVLVIVLLAYFTNANAPEEEDEVFVKEGRLFHEMLTLSVIPSNLGVETVGGVMTTVIPKRSMDFFKGSKLFTTSRDQQTNVTIQVFTGNSRLTNKCFLLGKFNLTGIPPAPRGTPRIEVTLEADLQGTLIVKAEDKASGKSEKIEIPNDANFKLLEFMEREEMEEKKERERIVAIYGKYKITNKLEAEAKELAETSTSDNENAIAIAVDQDMHADKSHITMVMDAPAARREVQVWVEPPAKRH